jgi:hypothetical protein
MEDSDNFNQQTMENTIEKSSLAWKIPYSYL